MLGDVTKLREHIDEARALTLELVDAIRDATVEMRKLRDVLEEQRDA